MNDNHQSSRNPRRASRRPNMRRTADSSAPVSRPVRTNVSEREREDTHAYSSPASRCGNARTAAGGNPRVRTGGNAGSCVQKRIPMFYLIYASAVVLVLAALAFGVVALRSFLTEYESAQPIHVAEEVFKTHFAHPDYNGLKQYFTPADYAGKYGYDSDADVINAMNECVKGKKMAFFKAATDLGDTIEYSVTADGVKIATISLKESDEKTKRGYVLYRLDSIRIYDVIGYSRSQDPTTEDPTVPEIKFTVVAPASYQISVDGTALTEEHIAKSYYDTGTLHNMPSDYQGIPYAEYSWKSTEPPDEVKATDSNGDAAEAQYDEKTHTYTFSFVYNKQLETEYSAYAIEAAQKLAAYMQAGLRFDDIAKYYDPSAKLYAETRAIGADAWMVNKYDSMEFKDVFCGEFYQYSETSFACRVSMIQIGHRAGYADSTDPIDYTFFFRLVDGKYLMYERYNN